MQKEQSAFLTAFYRDWLAWVEAGAVEGKPYSIEKGLCGCSMVFEDLNNDDSKYIDLIDEMAIQFAHAGLNHRLPFDDSLKDYHAIHAKHKNEKRLKWVKDHAMFPAQ